MNQQQGFATVLLLSLLPVLLALGSGVLFSFSVLKQDLGALNVCRAGQLEVQNAAGKDLQKLMSLNPRAQRLRKQKEAADRHLQNAIVSGNSFAIAAAEAEQAMIIAQQGVLDFRQKGLIVNGNTKLSIGIPKESEAIRKEWEFHQQPMNAWLSGKIAMIPASRLTLAVHPDRPDLAPIYETDSDFERKMTWLQSWNVEFHVVGVFRKFLTFHGHFVRSCSTSLYPEEKKWVAKLKNVADSKGKSFSRGFF